jgi:spermidine synthase
METIETIAQHNGPRGEVVLRRRLDEARDPDEFTAEELIINGVFAMDSSETSTEYLLGQLAIPSGRAQRVLVGGLGLGYTVSAISAQEIDEIDVVEIEQCLIDWAHQGVTSRLAAVASDPRIRLHAGDVRLVLQGRCDALVGPWDAIVLDVDNGPDFLIHGHNRALYTGEVLRAAYAQLTAGGTLAIWCQSAAPLLRAVLEHITPSTREHAIEVSRGQRRFRYVIYTVSRPPDSLSEASALKGKSLDASRRPGTHLNDAKRQGTSLPGH